MIQSDLGLGLPGLLKLRIKGTFTDLDLNQQSLYFGNIKNSRINFSQADHFFRCNNSCHSVCYRNNTENSKKLKSGRKPQNHFHPPSSSQSKSEPWLIFQLYVQFRSNRTKYMFQVKQSRSRPEHSLVLSAYPVSLSLQMHEAMPDLNFGFWSGLEFKLSSSLTASNGLLLLSLSHRNMYRYELLFIASTSDRCFCLFVYFEFDFNR